MTVRELLEILRKHNWDLDVVVKIDGRESDIQEHQVHTGKCETGELVLLLDLAT